MKNLFYILIFIPLSCYSQNDNCERGANFGGNIICLPKLDGYSECFHKPAIQTFLLNRNIPTNIDFGFYLNQTDLGILEKSGVYPDGDYIKVFGVKAIANLKADQSVLQMLINEFKKDGCDSLIHLDFNEFDFNVSLNEPPKCLKNYSYNNSSFSKLMLSHFIDDNGVSVKQVMTLNLLLLDERIICFCYYSEFRGEKSVELHEQKNNSILKQTYSN